LVNFLFICSNNPAASAYISQCIRYSSYCGFL